jgi:hypothetical protein
MIMTNAKTADGPVAVRPVDLQARVRSGAVLIVAAGFERRARRALEILRGTYAARVVLVRYAGDVPENEATYAKMAAMLNSSGAEWETLRLDSRHPDAFHGALTRALLRWKPESIGDIWIDVTALPMQGICVALAAIRENLPGLGVHVLYTEAGEYYPSKREAFPLRHGSEDTEGSDRVLALSHEMSANLIPKHFGGSSSEQSTCLIVFAGYEKHRSLGVVDELNPSKLVLVFGSPEREELSWRLKWSQILHKPLRGLRPTADEIVSTLDPWASLRMLRRYYGYLFVDHNIAVSPICSKMQCVAVYLFWEQYRDVQLVFPLPVSYLPQRFSRSFKSTFEFVLPNAAEVAATIGSGPLG